LRLGGWGCRDMAAIEVWVVVWVVARQVAGQDIP